jgi:soluble cytochrome b562
LGKIPPEANLAPEVADFRILTAAYELTWSDSATAYEAAIVRLQSIGRNRPLYGRAQALMQQWREEIQGLAQLDWARRVAAPGTVNDLRAAIAEAHNISSDSPRWGEAQDQIQRWRREISTIEDGPTLEQAQALARRGDRAALNAAINVAGAVGSNSALYGDAQDLIADWRWSIQRLDNQPILAQARQLANSGNVAAAIATARQIPTGQAFYDEAQDLIATWEAQTRPAQPPTSQAPVPAAQNQNLQQAYQLAETGTASALNQAIILALTVPESSDRWSEAQGAANQWSWEILQQAEAEAGRSPNLATQLAQQIPPRTEAYAAAQLRIREWAVAESSTTTP